MLQMKDGHNGYLGFDKNVRLQFFASNEWHNDSSSNNDLGDYDREKQLGSWKKKKLIFFPVSTSLVNVCVRYKYLGHSFLYK